MQNKLVKQFQDILSFYEKVIGVSEEIYQSLLKKDKEKISNLNKKGMMLSFELNQKVEEMNKEVGKECHKHNISDINVVNLYPYFTTEEREKMMACRETAFHFEKKLKNVTKKIECQAIAYIETEQVVIDACVHIAKEEDKGSNLFIDQEF